VHPPSRPKCSVSINYDALNLFSAKITEAILANKSLQVSEWDADGWHYTGKNYREKGVDNKRNILMKMERVALYVLAMVRKCTELLYMSVSSYHN
jgi:hypothetical protein